MDNAGYRADIDRPMNLLPALTSQTSNPALGGSDGQRNQQYKRRKTHGDISALGDVLSYFRKIEKFIEHQVSNEVQTCIEKSKESQHTPEADKLRKPRYPAKRSNR